MRRIKIILSLCLSFICTVGFAQTASDYRKAAEQGDANAQYNLGVCYDTGKGVTQDFSQAVYWYRKAAEQGDADAQFNLGVCYDTGKGVTQDYSQAVYWFRKAAEQGDAEAQYNLGVCYYKGYGVTQDYSQAVQWYRKAAEQGVVLAQYNLGVCYGNGEGVTQDYSQAVYWFRKAAEQGDAEAQYNLGRCYYTGYGVTQDFSQAVYWYRKAAEQGNADAQYNLGRCYFYGFGVKEDDDLAEMWLTKVIANPKSSDDLKAEAEDLLDIYEDDYYDIYEDYYYDFLDSFFSDNDHFSIAASVIDELIFGGSNKSTANDHEYVDLGLSVLWATCNVGASKPEEYGDYFAWGETSPKSRYSWDNTKYRTSGDSYKNLKLSKYVINKKHGTIDNKTSLELSDDAAHANWGGKWRMPTRTEQDELREKCIWTWTTINGKNGYKVVSKINGNSIFLPAAGYKDGSKIYYASFDGFYWSSTLCYDSDMDALYLFFLSNKVDRGIPTDRYRGHSVRPVMEKETAQSTPSSSNILNSSEKVYSSIEVDEGPKFNGGDMGEFTKWVNQNVVYPDIAKQYDIKGRVITKFTIHSNGQISDIQILKGVDSSLDKEAINVLKKAPTLTPAKKGGENVAVSYMLPIDFGR